MAEGGGACRRLSGILVLVVIDKAGPALLMGTWYGVPGCTPGTGYPGTPVPGHPGYRYRSRFKTPFQSFSRNRSYSL
eukprot:1161014-Rhodomonas_salina.1